MLEDTNSLDSAHLYETKTTYNDLKVALNWGPRFIVKSLDIISATSQENLSSEISDHLRHKPACSAYSY